jgi:hypothetical protein
MFQYVHIFSPLFDDHEKRDIRDIPIFRYHTQIEYTWLVDPTIYIYIIIYICISTLEITMNIPIGPLYHHFLLG